MKQKLVERRTREDEYRKKYQLLKREEYQATFPNQFATRSILKISRNEILLFQ